MRASSAQRYALCPGSARASWGLPSGSSEAADRGNRIHAYLAAMFSGMPATLDEEEAELAQRLMDSIDAYLPDGQLTYMVEHRMEWLGWTGHVDLIVQGSESDWILVVDWKTGWGELPEPAVNAQLRVYSALAFCEFGKPVRATLCTPRGVASPVLYDADAIEEAWKELDSIADACRSAGAPRIPDPEACKYCPAFGRPTCPETCEAIAVIDEVPAELTDIEGGSLGRLGAFAKLAEKRIAQVMDEIRRRLEENQEVPGCSLGKGKITKTVNNIGEAFARLTVLEQEEFLSACTLSLPKLADALAKATDMKKTEARREIDTLLADLIDEKQSKSPLKIGG